MSWCDYCDEDTPNMRCQECGLEMCANCERCGPCIYGDWYDDDT